MELLVVALNPETVNKNSFSFTYRAQKLQIASGHFFISMSNSEYKEIRMILQIAEVIEMANLTRF